MPPRKPTPREIRRAFGADALAVIDSHADSLEDLTKIVSAHDALIHPEHGALCQDMRDLKAFRARRLIDRLRWVFTGR